MNVSELKNYKQMESDAFKKMDILCMKTGNCAMNGFLGSSLTDCVFDESGVLEFSSSKKVGDTTVESVGCVLDDSILIKQLQKSPISDYNKLYSWNIEDGVYTYLEFDDKAALNTFYNRIKRFGISLCDNDLSTSLIDMGLSFDNVTKVLIRQKVDPLSVMFDEELSGKNNTGVNSLKI